MIVPDLIKAVEAGQEKARLEIQGKHHMNNRIQQLALQAGLKQRIWNSLGKELPMWQEDPDNPGLEKFAELIVRECIDIVPLDLPSTQYNKVMQAFEKHFGETE